MVDHARLALGPRRLAVHAGAGWTARGEAKRKVASRPVEELKRVDGLRTLADFEVKLRRPHLSRLARFGNHLATLDGVPALHQKLTRMGICGDVAVGVPNQDEIA